MECVDEYQTPTVDPIKGFQIVTITVCYQRTLTAQTTLSGRIWKQLNQVLC
jgi:hypothetical protein